MQEGSLYYFLGSRCTLELKFAIYHTWLSQSLGIGTIIDSGITLSALAKQPLTKDYVKALSQPFSRDDKASSPTLSKLGCLFACFKIAP